MQVHTRKVSLGAFNFIFDHKYVSDLNFWLYYQIGQLTLMMVNLKRKTH